MKAANGAIYDVDLFITVRSGMLSVTEASVHKINGKPVYNWKEEGGIFKKVKVYVLIDRHIQTAKPKIYDGHNLP